MRRVAAHVGHSVAEESWPALVEAARFESMKRDAARLLGPMDKFVGGPDAFLYKGSNGRWREALTRAEAMPSLDPDAKAVPNGNAVEVATIKDKRPGVEKAGDTANKQDWAGGGHRVPPQERRRRSVSPWSCWDAGSCGTGVWPIGPP